MRNVFSLFVVVACLMVWMPLTSVQAGEKGEAMKAQAMSKEVKGDMAGKKGKGLNKVCPVMGSEIPEEQMGKISTTYKGKVYNFCCPGCVKMFNEDPEKYSKIADAEVAARLKSKKGEAKMKAEEKKKSK